MHRKIMDRVSLLLIFSAFALLPRFAASAPAERVASPPDAVLEEEDHVARPGSLPLILNYKGREANAAWRKEAEARIEKVRKGEIEVVVNDASGKAISGADVAVKMKRHAFSWG